MPSQATRLVGRQSELATGSSLLLDPDIRMLTLTGPGKTRLAIGLAELVEPMFVDGTAFVDLAALTDPQLLLSSVAHALGCTTREARRWINCSAPR